MHAKVDETPDRLSHRSLFVPDIAGPRALPSSASSAVTARCFTVACAGCRRCRPPRWSK